MLNSLADLFERDIAEIATDPHYMKPEQGPGPVVKKLRRAVNELRSDKR